MNILTQVIDNLYNQDVTNTLNFKLNEYIALLSSSLSAVNYGELVSSLSESLQLQAR